VRETKKQMFIYTILLFPCAIAPYWLGVAGPLYGMAAAALGGLFVLSSIAVWRDDGDKSAKRMFGYSIFYLFALFGAMILDRGVGLIG
jgi:heme o synthase